MTADTSVFFQVGLDIALNLGTVRGWREAGGGVATQTILLHQRLQFARDRSQFAVTDNQVFLQYIMSLGAHGAHKF